MKTLGKEKNTSKKFANREKTIIIYFFEIYPQSVLIAFINENVDSHKYVDPKKALKRAVIVQIFGYLSLFIQKL